MGKWKLNGYYIPNDPKLLLPSIISGIDDLKYWSFPALKDLYQNLLLLSIQMAKEEQKEQKGGQRAKLTRLISSIRKKITFALIKQFHLISSYALITLYKVSVLLCLCSLPNLLQ